MQTSKHKEKGLIDIFKLLFSIGIVAIHSDCLSGNDYPSWIIMHSILRLGVPFFFCVSGYFLYKSLKKDKNEKKTRNKYIKRLLIPFVFWLLLNFPLLIIQYSRYGYSTKLIISKIIKGLLFYPWGALWYVMALIVAILIIIPFYKKNKMKQLLIVSLILYLISLVFNSYYFAANFAHAQKLIKLILDKTLSMRNGVFEGLFFVTSGMMVAELEEKKRITKRTNIVILAISHILLIIEILLTKNLAHIDDHSLFISFIIVIPSLVMLLSRYHTKFDAKLLRNYSAGIYFSHRFILAIITLFILKDIDNAWIIFGITLGIDLLLLSILYKINNEKINRLIT